MTENAPNQETAGPETAPKTTKRRQRYFPDASIVYAGRGERIRTSGPYVPNVVLYQAELLPGRKSPGDLIGPMAGRSLRRLIGRLGPALGSGGAI